MEILKAMDRYVDFHANLFKYIDTLKIRAISADENFFDDIDFEDDTPFFSPLISSLILAGKEEVFLKYIFFYRDGKKSTEIMTDQTGAFELVGYGYFRGAPNTDYKLSKDKDGIEYPDSLTFVPYYYLSETNIKLRMIGRAYHSDYLGSHSLIDDRIIPAYISPIEKALELLQKINPLFFERINILRCEIQLFANSTKNSFATIEFFPCIFINIFEKDCNYIYFIEEISHQAGHLLFYVITSDPETFFKVSMDTLFRQDTYDKRTIYVAFHGLFTYSTILENLGKLLVLVQDPRERLEVQARIGIYLKKFAFDMNIFNDLNIFSERGNLLFTQFKSTFDFYKKKFTDLTDSYNYEGQPYNFDFNIFLKYNQC